MKVVAVDAATGKESGSSTGAARWNAGDFASRVTVPRPAVRQLPELPVLLDRNRCRSVIWPGRMDRFTRAGNASRGAMQRQHAGRFSRRSPWEQRTETLPGTRATSAPSTNQHRQAAWIFHTIPQPGESRQLAARRLQADWRRECVGGGNGRRQNAMVFAATDPRRSTSTASIVMATTCLRTASSRSTREPANGSGIFRVYGTTCGIGTFPLRRIW
jgi:hypothetical protein